MNTLLNTKNNSDFAEFLSADHFTRKKIYMPAGASMMMAAFDSLALIAALYMSVFIGGHLASFFDTTPITLDYLISTRRDQIYFAVSAGVVLLFYGSGQYTQRLPWWSQVQFVCRVIAYAVILDGFLSFATELRYSRLLILLNWGFGFLFILLGRQIVQMIQKKSRESIIPTTIIGDSATVTDMLYALNTDSSMGYEPDTILIRDMTEGKFNRDNLPKKFRKLTIRNGMHNYEQFIHLHRDHFFVISLESFHGDERENIIAVLNNAKVEYAVIPSIKDMSIYEMNPRYFFGNDVMLLHATPAVDSPIENGIKRSMDILVSGLALLLLSPIFLLTAAMLKLEGQKGSVLYDGKRIGRNGVRFKCWKFRTMDANSDHLLHEYLEKYPLAKAQWKKYRKLPRDPRVTTYTARIVRKLSIDELPQLWNVLKGDMSIVGPRPILEDEVDYFGNKLDEYLSVKPGITGLWQVSGRNAVSFERRVYWDSWYVRNWSLWGDIVIILKTLPALMRRADAS